MPGGTVRSHASPACLAARLALVGVRLDPIGVRTSGTRAILLGVIAPVSRRYASACLVIGRGGGVPALAENAIVRLRVGVDDCRRPCGVRRPTHPCPSGLCLLGGVPRVAGERPRFLPAGGHALGCTPDVRSWYFFLAGFPDTVVVDRTRGRLTGLSVTLGRGSFASCLSCMSEGLRVRRAGVDTHEDDGEKISGVEGPCDVFF